jgi:hypothetical protein
VTLQLTKYLEPDTTAEPDIGPADVAAFVDSEATGTPESPDSDLSLTPYGDERPPYRPFSFRASANPTSQVFIGIAVDCADVAQIEWEELVERSAVGTWTVVYGSGAVERESNDFVVRGQQVVLRGLVGNPNDIPTRSQAIHRAAIVVEGFSDSRVRQACIAFTEGGDGDAAAPGVPPIEWTTYVRPDTGIADAVHLPGSTRTPSDGWTYTLGAGSVAQYKATLSFERSGAYRLAPALEFSTAGQPARWSYGPVTEVPVLYFGAIPLERFYYVPLDCTAAEARGTPQAVLERHACGANP